MKNFFRFNLTISTCNNNKNNKNGHKKLWERVIKNPTNFHTLEVNYVNFSCVANKTQLNAARKRRSEQVGQSRWEKVTKYFFYLQFLSHLHFYIYTAAAGDFFLFLFHMRDDCDDDEVIACWIITTIFSLFFLAWKTAWRRSCIYFSCEDFYCVIFFSRTLRIFLWKFIIFIFI